MRQILLLAIAGLASLTSSAWGAFLWVREGSGHPHSTLFLLACLFPILSIVAFTAYLRWPLAGLAFAWMLLSAGFGTAFLLKLGRCPAGPCIGANAVTVAMETLTGSPHLWLLAATAACLLLHSSSPADPRTLPANPKSRD